MRKFHQLVKQVLALYSYSNQGIERYIWLRKELTPQPTPEDLKIIHGILEEMSAESAKMGTDSTQEERYLYTLKCNNYMQQIKIIDEPYYWSIQIQNE